MANDASPPLRFPYDDREQLRTILAYPRGVGYVLDFSDERFAAFFNLEFEVDINADCYSTAGTSKEKRLLTFLRTADAALAIRVLEALRKRRKKLLARPGEEDPLVSGQAQFEELVQRLQASQTSLPVAAPPSGVNLADAALTECLAALNDLSLRSGQQAGYDFEKLLTRVFTVSGLIPRKPFTNLGEQIDGSIHVDETYLVEAKFRIDPSNASDLHILEGKLTSKPTWTRGLFISFRGFSPECFNAYRGRNVICMDGVDLRDALRRQIPLASVVREKARAASHSSRAFVPVHELFPEQ